MGSVHDVISEFQLRPNAERGTKFEQLMVRYFGLPTMAQQYDAVWRWIDWPGGGAGPTPESNLVARERDTGNYTAIRRVQFYDPNAHTGQRGHRWYRVGQDGFTNRVIISTTDRWGRNAETRWRRLVPVRRIGMAGAQEIADRLGHRLAGR